MSESGSLELLHDHHKDTFSYLRERERQRDRLFLILIALFALLVSSVLYSASLLAVSAQSSVGGAQVNVSTLPPRALLSASWVFTLAISLRYCQVSITVERQYAYLHMLEEKISQALGDPDLYRRESRAYLTDYPTFSNWAWFNYVAIFPFLAVSIATGLGALEWVRFPQDWLYNLFDSGVALATAISFFLYRILAIFRRI